MIPSRSPRTRSGAATSDANPRSAGRRARIGRDVVDDLRIAGEDRPEDPGAGIDGRLGIVVARPDLERPVRPTAQADEPATAGRQTARLADRDPGDGIGLERRPDLVGQVVDEVELAVAVERLAGQRTLVRLAGAGVGQHGRDGARRARALDPADRSSRR